MPAITPLVRRMRLVLKFIHVLGAMLFIGASASFIALASFGEGLLPGQVGLLPQALAFASAWIALPALVATLTTGSILMVQQPLYLSARWLWAKAALGLLVATLAFVLVQPAWTRAAAFAAQAAGGASANLTQRASLERGVLYTWIELVLAVVIVALAMWRPRLGRSG